MDQIPIGDLTRFFQELFDLISRNLYWIIPALLFLDARYKLIARFVGQRTEQEAERRVQQVPALDMPPFGGAYMDMTLLGLHRRLETVEAQAAGLTGSVAGLRQHVDNELLSIRTVLSIITQQRMISPDSPAVRDTSHEEDIDL